MKVVLIGFRATGKTSVGKALAGRLGLPFYDLDRLIEERAGRSISEIVAEEGWPAFRRVEREMMFEVASWPAGVIALGGGAVMHEDEMKLLKQNACVVWLKAPPEIIARRLATDEKTLTQRPSLTGAGVLEEIETLLTKREPLYHRFADLELDSHQEDPETLAERISKLLKRCLCGRGE